MGIPDRRQFIISTTELARDRFRTIRLNSVYILSYDQDLHVMFGSKGILLGDAFSTNCTLQLSEISLENIQYFAGRFVYIENDKVYLDACGSLGIYYSFEQSNVIISSSLNLISEVSGVKWNADYFAESGKDGLLDYYPIPYTPYKGVKKVLPSQILDFEGNISFRSDYFIPRYKGQTVSTLRTSFIEGMSCEMHNISKKYGENVWISLTSGFDSRVNFAVAKYSGIPFHPYTALRTTLKEIDLKRAKQICRRCGIVHETIDDRVLTTDIEARVRDFDKHTGGHITFGTERTQYIANSDVNNANESIVLWGTLWAVTYKAYENYMQDAKSPDEIVAEITKWSSYSMGNSSVHKASINEWAEYTVKNPIEGMDWRQRLYWEQRNGSWVSAAQQGIDLFDSLRISPINCQYLIELLLSYPEEYQHDKRKQKDIVNTCCPEIRFLPYGESFLEHKFNALKRKLNRMIKE